MIPVQEAEVDRHRFGGRWSLRAAQIWGGLALFLAVAPMSILWLVVSEQIDTDGWIIVVPILVMVLIASAPLVLRVEVAERMRIKSAALFSGGLVYLIMSGGLYYLVYLPALVCLVMAAVAGLSRITAPTAR